MKLQDATEFEIVKEVYERHGGFVASISYTELDVSTAEQLKIPIRSETASIKLVISWRGIKEIEYATKDLSEIEYFKSKIK